MSDWKTVVGPLLEEFAPKITTVLAGEIPVVGPFVSGIAGDMVGKFLSDQFGVPNTPTDVAAAIAAAPADVAQQKIIAAENEAVAKWPALAQIEQAQAEAFKAGVADNEAARQSTLALAQAGSAIAWGAPIVSTLVVVTFGLILILWLVRPPQVADANALAVLNVLIGTQATAFIAVVNYWLGSSASSRQKDSVLGLALQHSQEAAGTALKSANTVVSKIIKR